MADADEWPTTLLFRRNTRMGWLAKNPVLASGEPGYERDTGKLKMGNGVSTWIDLDYVVSEDSNLTGHITDFTPHPEYDDIPSLALLFENGLV